MTRDHDPNPSTDASLDLQVADPAGRRRFLRAGSALVTVAAGAGTLAGAALVTAAPAAAGDCDRGGTATAEQKAAAGQGSDSDQGAGSDPIGCGRTRHETPKISAAPGARDALPPTVARVRS